MLYFRFHTDSNSGIAKDSASDNDGGNDFNSGSDNDSSDSDHNTYKSVLGYDVDLLQQNKNPFPLELMDAVRTGTQSLPVNFSLDINGHPTNVKF